MAGSSPESDGPGRADAASALPAPYVDPWRLLRRDLGAVAASTRLRLRELVRLNRQGDLPCPAFWPGSWAAWFWPLVLAAALGALLALGTLLLPALPWSRPPATVPAEPRTSVNGFAAAGDGSAAESPDGSMQPGQTATGSEPRPGSSQPKPLPPPPSALPSPSVPAPDGVAQPSGPSAAESVPPAAESGAPPAAEDPLIEVFQATTPEGELVLQVESVHATRLPLLQLQLDRGWAGLPAAERQRLADGWQQRSRQLDYDALELRDPEGRLLARSARVGSGMILLSPP